MKMKTQEETKPTRKWQPPEWQFCHAVGYNGTEQLRLTGNRMTLAVTPTRTPKQYLVGHAVTSSKDMFCRRIGRTIAINRVEKYRHCLNTQVDYPVLEEYNIVSPKNSEPVMFVRRYKHCNVFQIVDDNPELDTRDHANLIAYFFENSQIKY